VVGNSTVDMAHAVEDEMQIEFSARESSAMICPQGRLDFAMRQAFQTAMHTVLRHEESKSIKVNLAGVHDIDGSGLALLLMLHERAVAAGKRTALVGLSDRTRQMIEIAGLGKLYVVA
jgi:anti-anti-sigma factor